MRTSTVWHNSKDGILVYDACGILIGGDCVEGNVGGGIAASGSALPVTTSSIITGNMIVSNAEPGISFRESRLQYMVSNGIGIEGSLARPNNAFASAWLAVREIIKSKGTPSATIGIRMC